MPLIEQSMDHDQREYHPLYWAEKACDTLMAKYTPEKLPPAGRFHYHQGVFLLGMERCWRENQNNRYFQYIKQWVDIFISPDGDLKNYNPEELDAIQGGILLFDIYEITGAIRYQKALSTLVSLLHSWPRNAEGGFWHKAKYPNQMWLDGLFMAGPIAVQYGKRFNQTIFYDLVVNQALLMAKRNKDQNTGLFYHGWDASGKMSWADPDTGTSPEFWGRAIGWYSVALLDILDNLPQNHPGRTQLIKILGDLIIALLKYQNLSSGLWYQVVDKGDQADNWLETSCSSLFVYSIAKTVRKGFLDKDYIKYAWKGFQGIIDRLSYDQAGGVIIKDICVGTSVGDYAYYIARPRSENDLHGVGAFVLMCVEMSRIN